MRRYDQRRVFPWTLELAIDGGLSAAALADRDGNTIGLAGDITEEEAMPLAAIVMFRLKSDDLSARLFAGEILTLALDDREIAVGVAARQLFVVAVMKVATPALLEVVERLRTTVAGSLLASDPPRPLLWPRNRGGSGSGPAALPLVEFGITVARGKPN